MALLHRAARSKKGNDENPKTLERPVPAVRIGDTRGWLCQFQWAQELVPLPAGQLSAPPTPRHSPSGKTLHRESSKAGSHEKSPPLNIEAEQTFLTAISHSSAEEE